MGIWTRWKERWAQQPQPIDPEHNERVQALCQVLRELIATLNKDGETHWRDWMATSLAALEANDQRGVQHLKGAYGGMGSFNDLVIGQRMGEDGLAWTADATSINDQLDALRTRAYVLATDILGNPR
jgi:hypothetical protein